MNWHSLGTGMVNMVSGRNETRCCGALNESYATRDVLCGWLIVPRPGNHDRRLLCRDRGAMLSLPCRHQPGMDKERRRCSPIAICCPPCPGSRKGSRLLESCRQVGFGSNRRRSERENDLADHDPTDISDRLGRGPLSPIPPRSAGACPPMRNTRPRRTKTPPPLDDFRSRCRPTSFRRVGECEHRDLPCRTTVRRRHPCFRRCEEIERTARW